MSPAETIGRIASRCRAKRSLAALNGSLSENTGAIMTNAALDRAKFIIFPPVIPYSALCRRVGRVVRDRIDICAGLDADPDRSGLRDPAFRGRPARGALPRAKIRRCLSSLQGARAALLRGQLSVGRFRSQKLFLGEKSWSNRFFASALLWGWPAWGSAFSWASGRISR